MNYFFLNMWNSKPKHQINNWIYGKLTNKSFLILDSYEFNTTKAIRKYNPDARIKIVEKNWLYCSFMKKSEKNYNVEIVKGLIGDNLCFAEVYILDYMCTIMGNVEIKPLKDISNIFAINPAAVIYLTICLRSNKYYSYSKYQKKIDELPYSVRVYSNGKFVQTKILKSYRKHMCLIELKL